MFDLLNISCEFRLNYYNYFIIYPNLLVNSSYLKLSLKKCARTHYTFKEEWILPVKFNSFPKKNWDGIVISACLISHEQSLTFYISVNKVSLLCKTVKQENFALILSIKSMLGFWFKWSITCLLWLSDDRLPLWTTFTHIL